MPNNSLESPASPSRTVHKTIHVHVTQHRATGLFMGLSPDLPGFVHTAPTLEQFNDELIDALRDMLEASGGHVKELTSDDALRADSVFDNRVVTANAQLELV